MNKTPKSQIAATRAWEKNNKEQTRVRSYRRTARLFIRSHATLKDLEEVEDLVKVRREELQFLK